MAALCSPCVQCCCLIFPGVALSLCVCVSVCLCVFVQVEVLQPHGNLLAKSGTDFKDLSRIDITLPAAAAAAPTAASGSTAANGAAAGAAAAAGSSGSSRPRPTFQTQHIQITSDMSEDPTIAEVCVQGVGGDTYVQTTTVKHGRIRFCCLLLFVADTHRWCSPSA